MAKVIVAKYAGFCFGVERAVSGVLKLAEEGRKVKVLGELIHNANVNEMLKTKGVSIIDDVSELEPGDTAVIRSHGAEPKLYDKIRAAGAEIVDLTCPFVARIHKKLAESENFSHIVIVGSSEHPEIIGTVGWAKVPVIVIPADADEEAIPEGLGNVLVCAQTTIKKADFMRICEALERKAASVEVFMSICDATEKRQAEAEELSKISDAVIVVGGKNSSNTRKLYEIAKKNCKNTQYVERTTQVFLDNMGKCDIISVIAGASTPDWIIREVRTQMSEQEKVQATEEEVKEIMPETETTVEIAEQAEAKEEAAAESIDEESNFAAELEKTFVRIRRGQFVKGYVVQVTENEICVNIGYKSDGILKLDEMDVEEDTNIQEAFPVGSEIEAEVVSLNDGEGNVVLSRKKIEGQLKWKKLADEIDENKETAVYECKVSRVIKGGVLTKLEGYDAFIPASRLSLSYVEDLNQFVGQTIKVKVIDVDKRQKRFVLSHKEILQAEAEEAEKALYAKYSKGEVVKGTVKRLTDFGAFVDIGGVDGLLHITDISWTRIKHPKDVLSENQEIEVRIKNVDPEKKKVSLEYRQLQPRPWDLVPEKYKEGDVVEGKVVRIAPFGAFVELEPSVDGLVHISQVTNRRIEKVEDVLAEGDVVTVKVLEVNAEKKRISLSIRALMEPAKQEKPEREERPERPRRNNREQNRRVERDADNNEFSYVMPTSFEEATTSLADLFKQLDD
ncbi:MAG: bifunctional 4-hydroxy-3-methylbut-2-enyl diphosphate reductase/30S ribosomal protein S1 [Christensenellaceae bacterium]|nr:bifunctional 4-hydroxy-3-methylbut-2-enyl diphosphate reductase/30S ribosomal protein S1 [Christensenellaceae bacterium]